jgi:hypothetical protein
MNTHRKGNRVRLLAKKQLESKGYMVAIVENPQKYAISKDAFGVADLIAIFPGESAISDAGRHTLLLQVTCGRPHVHKTYKEFAAKYCWDGLLFQQWVHIDNKNEWKKWRYMQNGEKEIIED